MSKEIRASNDLEKNIHIILQNKCLKIISIDIIQSTLIAVIGRSWNSQGEKSRDTPEGIWNFQTYL